MRTSRRPAVVDLMYLVDLCRDTHHRGPVAAMVQRVFAAGCIADGEAIRLTPVVPAHARRHVERILVRSYGFSPNRARVAWERTMSFLAGLGGLVAPEPALCGAISPRATNQEDRRVLLTAQAAGALLLTEDKGLLAWARSERVLALRLHQVAASFRMPVAA